MPPDRTLRIGASPLLLAHAVVTAAAGVVLVVAPTVIPSAVGVEIPGNAFVLCYLLAAAEFGFSWLSAWGARSSDVAVVRGVLLVCIVFHGVSGLLEGAAVLRGVSPKLWFNVAARAAIVILFAYARMPAHVPRSRSRH
jgi:hypothetical protein